MSPRTVCLYGTKGGQGVTTVAAALAITRGNGFIYDATPHGDAAVVLGYPAIDASNVTAYEHGPNVQRHPIAYGDEPPGTIIDAGLDLKLVGEYADRGIPCVLVTRACYLAMRRHSESSVQPSGVVLVTEEHRALGVRDVEAVVGAPVLTVIYTDAAVARAVDAGCLSGRLPRALTEAVRKLDACLDVTEARSTKENI